MKVVHIIGHFINHFGRWVASLTGGHEILNFIRKTFLLKVKLGRQNCSHSQSLWETVRSCQFLVLGCHHQLVLTQTQTEKVKEEQDPPSKPDGT